MSQYNIVSWNTRGLNSPVKHSLVFQFLKIHAPHICIHLVGSNNFARGVSILVRTSLPFKLLHLVLDLDGQYAIMHAQIEFFETTLVGIYICLLWPLLGCYIRWCFGG